MTLLALVRHGPTEWNLQGRIQGHTDIPLSEAGRAAVAGWRLPAELDGFDWIASPLGRAQETARLLRGAEVPADSRLREMAWGEWEGRIRAELSRTPEFAARELLGLDFETAAGESPRKVQARVLPLFAEIAARGRPTVAVTHRGVIRAVLALATGWPMLGKPPFKLDWQSAHLFRLDSAGHPTIERLNVGFEAAGPDGREEDGDIP